MAHTNEEGYDCLGCGHAHGGQPLMTSPVAKREWEMGREGGSVELYRGAHLFEIWTTRIEGSPF